jgi:hypothetical protein
MGDANFWRIEIDFLVYLGLENLSAPKKNLFQSAKNPRHLCFNRIAIPQSAIHIPKLSVFLRD